VKLESNLGNRVTGEHLQGELKFAYNIEVDICHPMDIQNLISH